MGREAAENENHDEIIEGNNIETNFQKDFCVSTKQENCVVSLLRYALPKVAQTPLITACNTGNLPLVQTLVQNGDENVNGHDSEGNTPLMQAAQAGFDSIVCYLLFYLHGEILVDAENNNGFTALMKAALHGKTNCARRLIIAGADVTKRDWGRGLQAHEWASFCGMRETALVIQKIASSCNDKGRQRATGVARAMHWNEEQWIRDTGSVYHLASKAADVHSGLVTSFFEEGPERIIKTAEIPKGENVMTCIENRDKSSDDFLVVEITSPEKQRVTQRCFKSSVGSVDTPGRRKGARTSPTCAVPTVNVIRASPSKEKQKRKSHHRNNKNFLSVPKASSRKKNREAK
uniref:Uncharacterized protein n=1 Tax=Ciona savignyi TaxID=51511 RepID=H2YUE5_CIOSA